MCVHIYLCMCTDVHVHFFIHISFYTCVYAQIGRCTDADACLHVQHARPCARNECHLPQCKKATKARARGAKLSPRRPKQPTRPCACLCSNSPSDPWCSALFPGKLRQSLRCRRGLGSRNSSDNTTPRLREPTHHPGAMHSAPNKPCKALHQAEC